MEKFGISFILALCVLLMTTAVAVNADEDDPESQENGWF